MEKAKARALVKSKITLLSRSAREEKDRLITQQILKLSGFRQAGCVMLFASLPDEVSTQPLIERALALGKTVALPRVIRKSRILLAIRLTAGVKLSPGSYNVYEPTGGQVVSPGRLQFVLVPGRAFDHVGNRLGRGGGYYDCFLSHLGKMTIKCGVGYDCQILDNVPVSPGDVPVDVVVTESGVITASAGSRL